MRVGSLFAGIGGFDLAAERVGWEVAWQVEIDPFCRKVLEKHWPHVRRYGDIRDCEFEPADVLVGGFPCQDISVAGYGAGLAGERSGLWREMVRAFRLVGPCFGVLENVAALLHRGMGKVLGDLADIGYDAEWDCLSACAFGAPHMRQRVFAVAYPNGFDGRSRIRNSYTRTVWTLQEIDGFADSRAGWRARLANPSALYGGADGIPDGMDRNHAIGNAVVPQVAEWIFRQIQTAEDRQVAPCGGDRPIRGARDEHRSLGA